MPPKLRPFVHILVVLIGTCALAWLGLLWLPAIYSVLWLIFCVTVAIFALTAIFGRDAASTPARPNPHRLTRSRDQWIMGVCGGIAEFLGWRPAAVRALWMVFSLLFAGFGGILIYTIMAFAMPSPPSRGGKFRLDDFRVQ